MNTDYGTHVLVVYVLILELKVSTAIRFRLRKMEVGFFVCFSRVLFLLKNLVMDILDIKTSQMCVVNLSLKITTPLIGTLAELFVQNKRTGNKDRGIMGWPVILKYPGLSLFCINAVK